MKIKYNNRSGCFTICEKKDKYKYDKYILDYGNVTIGNNGLSISGVVVHHQNIHGIY